MSGRQRPSVAVVIPSFRVRQHLLEVLGQIGPEVDAVYVVDDKCPEGSGALVEAEVADPRVHVLFHEVNQGVGGATLTGMCRAVADGASVVVKLDGDGQMDPALIGRFVRPILRGEADYTKGNRFYDPDGLHGMPLSRLFGNAALSFITKLSSGYWDVFDPTNGYLAIHAKVLRRLPLEKLSRRYFFESDLLFRLYTIRAVVADVPMEARYGDEESGLRIGRVLGPFLGGHLRNTIKRILYTYYLRDFSVASLYLPAGLLIGTLGMAFGAWRWFTLAEQGLTASAGTVMLAALPILLGVQFLLAFLAHDVANVPRIPLQARIAGIDPVRRGVKRDPAAALLRRSSVLSRSPGAAQELQLVHGRAGSGSGAAAGPDRPDSEPTPAALDGAAEADAQQPAPVSQARGRP